MRAAQPPSALRCFAADAARCAGHENDFAGESRSVRGHPIVSSGEYTVEQANGEWRNPGDWARRTSPQGSILAMLSLSPAIL